MAFKTKKLKFEELFTSTTMFYVNEKYEQTIAANIESKVNELFEDCLSLTSRYAMKQYILKSPNSLNNILLIRDLSEERFKRIVSMIRKDRGYIFNTEWSLSSIRSNMIENSSIMESVLDILWYGNSYTNNSSIPNFYLGNQEFNNCLKFKLANKEIIKTYVKKGFEGIYSNKIGDLILDDVKSILTDACISHNKLLTPNVRIIDIDRNVSFTVGEVDNPDMIIDVSYCVTTSSSQGTKREAARKTSEYIKRRNANGEKAVYIYFLDGAGWIGRQADMSEIHRRVDFAINFKNINTIYDIFNDFYNN